MKATKKDQKESPIYEYNATLEQIIPLRLEKNGKIYRVEHHLKPLTDSRFFSLEKQKEDISKTVSRSQTSILMPTATLWDDLILARNGYAPTDDIKKTYLMDKVKAILGLLYCKVVEIPDNKKEEVDVLDAEVLFDESELNEIKLEVMQSGIQMTTTHFFKEETQDQMDEYLAIISNTPSPSGMASAARDKRSKAERIAELYDEVHLKHFGYVDGTEVPAWHKLPAVMYFFAYQFNRMER